MPLIPKPNYNQIFASQAPEQDKPAVFNNYPLGWGVESRPNNGKPTIKGFNYVQQTSDLKDLWILQNGACLPYDESIEYAEGAPVLKDGVIQYKTAGGFKSRDAVTIPTYNSAADGIDPVTGVADGAYYNVRSTDDDSFLVEYQNIGGIATPTGKSYPSNMTKWDASFVVDSSGQNQQEINNSTVRHVPTVSHMLSLNPKNGDIVFVESYNPVNYALAIPYHAKGGGFFVYDSSKSAVNDGGIIIDGWVRLNFDVPDAYMFGAYGDWNADTQTGNDDTVAIQKMIDFVFNNKPDHRKGGSRIIKLLAGNYRHGTLNITAPDSRFSFEFIGDGLLSTVLWCDPTSDGILLGTENTRWKGIRFHGKLNASRHSTDDPSIEYLIKAKLPWKYLDIDAAFNECGVSFCRTFARVCGRGFNFKNGVISTSTTLFEIACDSDLIVAGNAPEIHGVQTALRHFRVTDNRFDAVSNVFTVSGTHEIKDYINGFEFSYNDVVTLNRIIEASDCTLISPRLMGNTAINSFSSSSSSAMFSVPRCFDLLDSDNKWFKRRESDMIGDDATKSIRYLYRFDYADGVTISKTTAKDLGFGVIRLGNPSKNIKLIGNNFIGFGDLQENTPIVDNYGAVDGLVIKDNTVTANIDNDKKYVRTAQTGSINTVIDGNDTKWLVFEQQAIRYNPKLRIGSSDSGTATYSNVYSTYYIDGDYCVVDVAFTVTETAASGLIGISLPIPAVSKHPTSSAVYAGEGALSTLSGFTLTNPPRLLVEASTSQTAKIMSDFSTQLNLSAKTGNTITIRGEFRYRFK